MKQWCGAKNLNIFTKTQQPPAQQKGLLDKIKFVVKDNIAVEGMGLSCGSPILENFISPYTADIVSSLLSAGSHLVGKTRMDEFGMGSHSITCHGGPVKTSASSNWKSPGGSSGGTAVALSLFDDINLGIGSDTGGSIRTPAAFLNLIGFKPSYSSLSRHGLVSYASSLDSIGLMCKDANILLNIYDFLNKTPSLHDSIHKPVKNHVALKKGNTIGYFSSYGKTNESIISAIEEAKKVFLGKDFILKEIPFSSSLYPFNCKTLLLYLFQSSLEARSSLARYPLKFQNPLDSLKSFGPIPLRRIELATNIYSFSLLNVLKEERERLVTQFEQIFLSCDYIITPTTPDLPPMISDNNSIKEGGKKRSTTTPPIRKNWDNDYLKEVNEFLSVQEDYLIEKSIMDDIDTFTVASNLSLLPSISIPSGEDGIGLHIITTRERERSLIEIALLFSTPRSFEV